MRMIALIYMDAVVSLVKKIQLKFLGIKIL
jgi:hypothetical protein